MEKRDIRGGRTVDTGIWKSAEDTQYNRFMSKFPLSFFHVFPNSAKYEAGTEYLVVDKKAVTEDFFILSSGLAGEILQKYINYGGKLAIYGTIPIYEQAAQGFYL